MRRLAQWLAIGALVACSPIYSTRYDYLPPEDANGRACVAMCRSAKSYCSAAAESRADLNRQRCELNAEREYERCLLRSQSDEARQSCHRRPCVDPGVDDAHCTDEFNACYEDCGGIVETVRRCEFNCDAAP